MEKTKITQMNEEFFATSELSELKEEAFDEGIYAKTSVEEMLEDDELSFEEAAFMTGYCDFA